MDQKTRIVEFLTKLDSDSLFTLARTITQGLLKINSNEEAVNAILKHSPDVLSILRRKSVTREILFSYLHEQNVTVKLPITKNELIDKILEYWNISSLGSFESCSSQTITTSQNKGTSREQSKDDSISLLAEQFSSWFYSMLNDKGVGSEHFYSDATFTVNFYSQNDCDTSTIENDPEGIAGHLFKIKLQYNLIFNPNITKEGTRGLMNPHGLVTVLSCGTLHNQQTCVGVFEQVFALARDPFCEDNWKIKKTELNLRSKGQITGPPRLCDSELTAELLPLTEH